MRRKAEPCLLLRSYLRRCSSHQLQNHPSLRSFGSLRTLPYFPLFQPSHHENRDPSQSLTHSKSYNSKFGSFVQLLSPHSPVAGSSERFVLLGLVSLDGLHRHHYHRYSSHRNFFTRAKQVKKINTADEHSQRAVTTALWCNFLVFSLKFGVWLSTSSHVMLAEVVHSVADFANQLWLFQGKICLVFDICCRYLLSWFWSYNCSWLSKLMDFTALVIGGSFVIEGVSLIVAIQAVKKGAAAEGMKVRDYIWRGHDPTSVAVMTEDGAAVTGLAIAGASLIAVNTTGNAIYDPIGSIIVGNLLGMVAIFLIQRNRHALIGRAIDDHDMEKVLHFLKNDPVVDALYDCKSEVIGPGFFRFKAEIDFNGVRVVQNYINRTGRVEWARQFREAAKGKDDTALLKIMSNYGEEVVTALGSEVDRLEMEIQELVPGIRHVDIEAHNPTGPSP
ncbi:metal tolerance protein C4 isoform X2 [Juglans microcarpa x Juglans regia]|uniref:metal tolerance protein C4 isoform X2 n=1 Tax=Juglans microcarpa x Juglans regia TaxID=2249226 RepID=UPI001B7ED658|nr:metal tolerance protein C4 isoform X2 [Juglans microcarpa x Juglans regia]